MSVGRNKNTEARKPPDKRCGCNTAASQTSVLSVDNDVVSECVGCGAVWSLADGTPPDYVGYLLKLLLEDGVGTLSWAIKASLPTSAAAEPEAKAPEEVVRDGDCDSWCREKICLDLGCQRVRP